MNLLSFIKKESLHVLRDKRMLLVVLAMPVVQMLLFGFAISTEVNNINVGVSYNVFNEDIRRAMDRIESNPYTTLKGTLPQADIYPAMQKGDIDAVVVFRNDKDIQIISDASNPNIAQSSVSYLQSIVTGSTAIQSPVTIRFLYNPQLKSAFNFVPGIVGMLFMLICAMMTAVSIVREKENGTLSLLLVSPVRPIQIIISKMAPFFMLSMIMLAMLLVISRYLLGVPMSGGALPIIFVTLIYIILSLSLGLLVSTVSKTQVMAILISGMVMIMPVVMLSGMLFPVDNLPIILKQLSAIVPARWYIDAMRKLMIEGLSLTDVWLDIVVLSSMVIFILAISIRNFKIRFK